MSQKSIKVIRKAAIKYAHSEEERIARFQQNQIYSLPFFQRLCYAFAVIFRWGHKKRE